MSRGGRRRAWRTVLLVIPLLVAAGAALIRWPTEAAAGSAAPVARSAQVDVEGLYQRDCAFCHGDDGMGTARGPSLDDDGPALVDYMLTTGRMPIQEPDDELDRSEPAYPPAVVDAMVRYIDELTGGGGEPIPDVDPASGDLPLGGELFRLHCAPCHQWAADGGALLYGPAPGLEPATAVQIAEAVRTGPGTMPRFDESAIDEHELNSVIAYIDYLDHPRDRGGWGLGHLGPLPEGFIAWTVGIGALLLLIHRIGEQR